MSLRRKLWTFETGPNAFCIIKWPQAYRGWGWGGGREWNAIGGTIKEEVLEEVTSPQVGFEVSKDSQCSLSTSHCELICELSAPCLSSALVDSNPLKP